MTDQADVSSAQNLLATLARYEAMQALQATNILSITVMAVTDGTVGRGPNRNPTLTVLPTDSQWSSVLQSCNQLLTSKIAAIKTQLANLGITGVT
jgi:hypothetical protein